MTRMGADAEKRPFIRAIRGQKIIATVNNQKTKRVVFGRRWPISDSRRKGQAQDRFLTVLDAAMVDERGTLDQRGGRGRTARRTSLLPAHPCFATFGAREIAVPIGNPSRTRAERERVRQRRTFAGPGRQFVGHPDGRYTADAGVGQSGF